MGVYGFTILRNGRKYDYPFRESLRSLTALCDEVVVALGDSDDGTEEDLAEFANVIVVRTTWDENLRRSGLILSQQTNVALEALRARHPSGWGVYLQADEVLHEADFPRIREDLARAAAAGADALSFRYLHFWQSYHRIAIDKRWYPQEVRAVRLDSAARSYGDAQGFEGVRTKFDTDAFVYHYGHVREANAYERKKADFNRWWHSDDEMPKILAKGTRRDKHETTLAFHGAHPSFMAARMGADAQTKAIAPRARVLVYGVPEEHSGFAARVDADIQWTTSLSLVWAEGAGNVIFLKPLPAWAWPLRLLGFGSRVPNRMSSPQARVWSEDFQRMLKFSERGVSVR